MQNSIVGVFCDEGTPVPIPNTVVKLIYADNTWLATAREDRSMPTYLTGTDFSSGFFLFVDTDCRILYNRENNACKGTIEKTMHVKEVSRCISVNRSYMTTSNGLL